MKLEKEFSKIEQIDSQLLRRFLSIYPEDCRHLTMAQFQYPEAKFSRGWSTEAEFKIPDSCCIKQQRLFNVFDLVEFNVCYNQLYYTSMAYMLKNSLLKPIIDWDLDTYQSKQSSNFLIVKCSTTVERIISSKKFYGTLKINRLKATGSMIKMSTSCAFYDINDGWMEGDVTVAILNSDRLKTSRKLETANQNK